MNRILNWLYPRWIPRNEDIHIRLRRVRILGAL